MRPNWLLLHLLAEHPAHRAPQVPARPPVRRRRCRKDKAPRQATRSIFQWTLPVLVTRNPALRRSRRRRRWSEVDTSGGLPGQLGRNILDVGAPFPISCAPEQIPDANLKGDLIRLPDRGDGAGHLILEASLARNTAARTDRGWCSSRHLPPIAHRASRAAHPRASRRRAVTRMCRTRAQRDARRRGPRLMTAPKGRGRP